MAHLLHQMVRHRTTLRGNGQISATIARITTHTHTTILIIKKRVIRVLRHAESPAGDPNPQARLGAGRYPLLNIVGYKVWIYFCKN